MPNDKYIMNILRQIYIKTTDITHGFQNKKASKFLFFYHLWAPFYDISIKLDPAFCRNLKKMIDAVVAPDNVTLDVGCGTGLSTICAAKTASKVVGIDPSTDMLNKLKKKIKKHQITNIDIRKGFFPEAVKADEKFQSIISSFMLAHLNKKQQTSMIKDMFNHLEPKGKIGLFSAQGEVASTFQTKEEIENNLASAGFRDIAIRDIDDIYRISTAIKN
jgi:cyclopropane fatty-acyl-phospholipid synthase-like methyltransferase